MKKLLKKQKYGISGNTAVKLCAWLKKSLRDRGVCYKEKFYGIKSHRCLQMTPSANVCNHNCLFCWRAMDYVRGKFEEFDEPKKVFEDSIREQRRLISGFKGDERTNQKKFKESENPNQVAISLIGEPTLYPYLDKLIKEYRKNKFTTFVVSNGTKPNIIEKINPTQLYLTLPAQDKETYERLCRPLIPNGWDKIKQSIEVMKKKDRSVIRLTLVKGWNMENPEKYIDLIDNNVDFIEAKAYMFVGYSRQRMTIDNMPSHKEVMGFAKQIEKNSEYKIVDEKKESRVVLLQRGNKKRIISSQ